VQSLPREIEAAYEEARSCMTTNSYTAVVLLCRVLLLHVAKDKKIQDPNPSYKACITYLVAEGWIGQKDGEWVDRIRAFGNEANHELKAMGEDEAKRALEFIQHVLVGIYEFRSAVPSTT
jgi:hypothetical protein